MEEWLRNIASIEQVAIIVAWVVLIIVVVGTFFGVRADRKEKKRRRVFRAELREHLEETDEVLEMYRRFDKKER